MDAMLMGGIVPTDLSQNFVTNYITTPLQRSKSFKWGAATFTARSWNDLIDQVCPLQKRAIIKAISDFLQASSSYGLIDGVHGLQVLKAARVQLINLGRPAVDLAIRIMKDMRKPEVSRAAAARQTFYDEEDPLIAVRNMQFAPGFGYYDNTLTPLPATLQERLNRYYDNDLLMKKSAVRASRLIAKKYPRYSRPFTMGLLARNATPPRITRQRGDTVVPRLPTTNEVLRERARKAAQKLQANIESAYGTLDPLLQYGVEPVVIRTSPAAAAAAELGNE